MAQEELRALRAFAEELSRSVHAAELLARASRLSEVAEGALHAVEELVRLQGIVFAPRGPAAGSDPELLGGFWAPAIENLSTAASLHAFTGQRLAMLTMAVAASQYREEMKQRAAQAGLDHSDAEPHARDASAQAGSARQIRTAGWVSLIMCSAVLAGSLFFVIVWPKLYPSKTEMTCPPGVPWETCFLYQVLGWKRT